MNKYVVRYKLAGESAYRKVTLELPDMEHAVKSGYDYARGMHGLPVIDFSVRPVRTY